MIVNDLGWEVESDVIRGRLELKRNKFESSTGFSGFYVILNSYSLTFEVGALSLSSSW